MKIGLLSDNLAKRVIKLKQEEIASKRSKDNGTIFTVAWKTGLSTHLGIWVPFFRSWCTEDCNQNYNNKKEIKILNKANKWLVNLGWVEIFDLDATFGIENPLPPEFRKVHIIEIRCVQNCHKASKKWALSAEEFWKNSHLLSNSRPKSINFEPNEYLLSLLRSWEMPKKLWYQRLCDSSVCNWFQHYALFWTQEVKGSRCWMLH